MKEKLKNIILILSCFLFTNVSAQESLIKVATLATLPPLSFLGSDDVTGMDIELIRAIAKDQNMNIHITRYPLKALFDGLNNSKIDLVVSGVFNTPERSKMFETSETYESERDAILYINPNLKIETDEDVKNLKIAALEHSVQAKDLVNIIGLPPENVITVKTVFLGYRAMLEGEVDAVANYEAVLRYLTKDKEGNFKFYTLSQLPERQVVALAKKGNKVLIDQFNQGLENLKANGEYNKIYQKWNSK